MGKSLNLYTPMRLYKSGNKSPILVSKYNRQNGNNVILIICHFLGWFVVSKVLQLINDGKKKENKEKHWNRIGKIEDSGPPVK